MSIGVGPNLGGGLNYTPAQIVGSLQDSIRDPAVPLPVCSSGGGGGIVGGGYIGGGGTSSCGCQSSAGSCSGSGNPCPGGASLSFASFNASPLATAPPALCSPSADSGALGGGTRAVSDFLSGMQARTVYTPLGGSPGQTCSPAPPTALVPIPVPSTGNHTLVTISTGGEGGSNVSGVLIQCPETGVTQPSNCGGNTFYFDTTHYPSGTVVHLTTPGGPGINCGDSSHHIYGTASASQTVSAFMPGVVLIVSES